VITGFTSGAALVIAAGQVKYLLGVSYKKQDTLQVGKACCKSQGYYLMLWLLYVFSVSYQEAGHAAGGQGCRIHYIVVARVVD
jgi:MFS superfamily sulfate permease-like transporter